MAAGVTSAITSRCSRSRNHDTTTRPAPTSTPSTISPPISANAIRSGVAMRHPRPRPSSAASLLGAVLHDAGRRPRFGRPRRAGSAGQRLPDRFRGMLGTPRGEVLDLLAARDAGGDDRRGGVRRLDSGGETAIAERDGEVVVLALEPERAGHAAAAGIDLADVIAGPLQ